MADDLRIERDHTRTGEYDHQSDQRDTNADEYSPACLLLSPNDRIGIERWMRAEFTQHLLSSRRKDKHAKQHPNTGCAKAPMPTNSLAQKSGNELTRKRSKIDAHVKDREARVAPRTAFRIPLTDDCRHVWFQKSSAEDDQDEADEERQLAIRERRQADRDRSEEHT